MQRDPKQARVLPVGPPVGDGRDGLGRFASAMTGLGHGTNPLSREGRASPPVRRRGDEQ